MRVCSDSPVPRVRALQHDHRWHHLNGPWACASIPPPAYVRHDSFIHVVHDSFICVTWLIGENHERAPQFLHLTHTHLNSSTYRWTHHVSHVTHMNESYDTHASVMSHVWVGVCVCVCMCICVCVCVCVDVCMCVRVGPVTRVNEWCHFFCKMRHILNGPWAQKLCHFFGKCVWISNVTFL